MNGEPELKDNSGALAGRFVWLPIVKSYLGREDASIKASVPQEAPGIMLLALEGLLRLRAMGRPSIEMCGEGQEIARGFEEDSAPLRIFVQTWLEHPPQPPLEHNWPTADRLYQAYECFCIKEERRKPLGFRKFIKNLRWHARPWTYSQPRSPDGTRPRRLEGWRIREDKLDVLAEFTTTRQARPDDELPLDFPS
jgi:phage/plasmid-associated DNA primase